ncbi:hypothetical protein SAMN06265173_102159 [Thalassovita litoralis]|uniref:Phosphoadenosine phosphosulfate reductase n=1 Tax=Thalassovita litoralis TaxID=1010611 RepID=A0A521B5Y8_9RHOB|nr:alpha/beta hydrolase [Thalassovita litoralis]SMO42522.1 hypothetical protein SAMN06265173_102159 [Thalassovita litoralis]
MKPKQAFRKCAFQAQETGFYRQMTRHFAVFVPRGRTLVVTFDNMKSREAPAPRYPWGWELMEKLGHSHLVICMTRRNDWFRHADLFDFFDELRDTGFFDQFEDVVFYGSSMGGYGALAYASAAPGARVVAYVPQTSLNPSHTLFETRYRAGFRRGDWQDTRYADALEGARTARDVIVFYDPFHELDRQHVDRLKDVALTRLRCPFMGHRVPRFLLQMGILRGVVTRALDGTLTEQRFVRAIEARKSNRGFVRSLLAQGLERGHPQLAAAALERFERSHGKAMPKYRRLVSEKLAA